MYDFGDDGAFDEDVKEGKEDEVSCGTGERRFFVFSLGSFDLFPLLNIGGVKQSPSASPHKLVVGFARPQHTDRSVNPVLVLHTVRWIGHLDIVDVEPARLDQFLGLRF